MIAISKLSACVAIGAGGALVGGMAGWETAPLTLELGQSGLAAIGTVGGTLVAIIGCCWASEQVQAKAKSRQQFAAINRLITLAVGVNPRTFSEELLPDERLAAVNAIGLMGPLGEKAVPVLLEVLKLSALDMAKHEALFLASIDALVKVGVVDQDVVTTLQTISEGNGVKPADKVDMARVATDGALRRLECLEPASCR